MNQNKKTLSHKSSGLSEGRKKIDLCLKDHRFLDSLFYTGLDLSICNYIFKELCAEKIPEKLSYCGEGTFFKAYRFSNKTIDYCLKLPKEDAYLKEKRANWVQKVRLLERLNHYLLPPIEIIGIHDKIMVITLFGTAQVSSLGEQWVPMDLHFENLEIYLKKHGLYLGEKHDIRFCKDIPFLSDFSDIHRF